MLAQLDPAQLDRLSFPLGGLTKDAVRALARDAGLPVADKRESQDLCFVAGLGGRAFLRRHGGPRLRRPGEIVDARRPRARPPRRPARVHGRPAPRPRPRRPEPLYVLGKDAPTNRVTVGPREALATTQRAPRGRPPAPPGRRGRAACGCATTPRRSPAARDRPAAGALELELAEPADAVAPGQLACLMRDDCVVGEGTIAGAH